MKFDVSTPAYVVDETCLRHNLEILKEVRERTGCHILLASKAFSMYHVFPLIGEYLDGVTSSGLYEATLGREEMNKEVHTFSPAYKEEEFEEILNISDHIVFNSVSQWNTYKDQIQGKASCGIRINPEYSEITTPLYDPCAPYSRMGMTLDTFKEMDLTGIEGLHMHTMCEQGADVLARTVAVLEDRFGTYLHQMKWLNLGGGHHITKPGYDIELLENTIRHLQDTYHIQVYLEPGEAVALQAGWLVARVLDIVENGMNIAILDASAACHMPDVLEMPYRPDVIGAKHAGELPYTYRLAGNTCLAGDVIGDYAFDHELRIGEHIIFCDMAIYSMVKNNTFNGVPLPSIYVREQQGNINMVKQFDYQDFKRRL